MSTQVIEPQILNTENIHKFRQIQTQLESSIHEHKKVLLQVKSQLEFERNRANQLEEKYKTAIRYQNEEKQLKKIMNELNEKLRVKEDEMLELIKSEQQNKLRISQLESDIEELQTTNGQFEQKLRQFQEGAVSAIIEKQNIIGELQQKLQLIELNESTHNSTLSVALMQFEEKYKQLQERSEGIKLELQSLLEQKQEEYKQLQERSEHQKEKLQERITRMQQEIQDYEKHIEHINQEKMQEQNLQEKYYILEEKLRKSQKRNSELELILNDLKKEYEEFLNKFTAQEEEQKNFTEQIKSLKLKIKDLGAEIKQKQKANNQIKHQSQKNTNQLNKKIALLENDKKKTNDTLDSKNMEIERLRVEIEEKIAELTQEKSTQATKESSRILNDSRVSLASEIKTVNIETNSANADMKMMSAEKFMSPVKVGKKQTEEQNRLIQKFKHQISDLESNNAMLSRKLQEKTKQLQELRQRLVSESGSASRSQEEAKLLCVIEDLSNHIKKLENNMITEKYKYAEDENFWKMREKNFKLQVDNLMRQFKKERSQLLERIDRMKKSGAGKDKKMDYYQSGFK